MKNKGLTIEDKQYLIGLLSSYRVIKPTAKDERDIKKIVEKLRNEV